MTKTKLTILAAAALVVGLLASGAQAPAAPTATAAAKLPIQKKLIPYPMARKNQMAAYSQRHYGESVWQLTAPKLIVIHYAEAGTIGSIYNTFAANRPDVEYHELPGVCSHFAVANNGRIVKFVPVNTRCRHVVGLNHVSVGIEHTGFSDGEVLGRKPQLRASLRLTAMLRCRLGIPVKGVIGHNESLSSPYYLENDPDFRGRTHGDFTRASMGVYRRKLAKLGC
jgi:N-acetylmuramoyl-L-alanine amidase